MSELVLDGERFVHRILNGKYEMIVPESVKVGFDSWEKERLESMASILKRGDVLFDIGSESGWQTLAYAQMVGSENICMFEPTPKVWRNAKLIFEANELSLPRASFCGFVSDHDSPDFPSSIKHNGWPLTASEGALMREMTFFCDQDYPNANRVTLDSFVEHTEIIPYALAIDTEGSEIIVLKGAANLLIKHRPLVWASLHPAFVDVSPVHELMTALEYAGVLLSSDHEEHYLWSPIHR